MKKAMQFSCWSLGGLALATLALTAWSQPPANEASVKLKVVVPDPNAMLTVDGTPTRQTGKERLFESPPLPLNKKYTYTIKITWTDNNKEKSETRKVRVQAGKDVTVDFTKPAPGTGKKDAMKDMDMRDMKKKDVSKKDKTKKDTAPLLDTGKTVDKANGATDKVKVDNGTKADKAKKDTNKTLDKAPLDADKAPLDKGAAAPRTRDFLFTYAGTVTGLEPGQVARVWVPLPPSNEGQRVRMVAREQPFRG